MTGKSFDVLIAELNGLFGFLLTWLSVFVSFVAIKDVVQILASLAAFVLSVITARYYFIKTKKLKDHGDSKL